MLRKLLSKTIINEFNNNFELLRTIQSDKIDIKTNDWIIYDPIITNKNISEKKEVALFYQQTLMRKK